MSTALGVTNSAVQAPLAEFGSDAQKQKYLKRLASGEILGSFCLTEAPRLRRRRNPDHAVRSPSCHSSVVRKARNLLFLTASTAQKPGSPTAATPASISSSQKPILLLAERNHRVPRRAVLQGFQIGRHEDKMGQRSSPSVELLLNNCEVPAENRSVKKARDEIALSALDGGRIGIAAQAVGLAQGALDIRSSTRNSAKAFGKSIAEFQAIQ